MLIYTGIGSRNTPLSIQQSMYKIAAYLASKGHKLRSGGADGADSAFELGVFEAKLPELAEIYLPWRGFNGNNSPYFTPSKAAFALAEKYHPAWNRLRPSVQALMARNSHQILGLKLDTPSDCVVCYTSDGKASGGTGQALRLAAAYNIPIFNLFFPESKQKLKMFVREHN